MYRERERVSVCVMMDSNDHGILHPNYDEDPVLASQFMLKDTSVDPNSLNVSSPFPPDPDPFQRLPASSCTGEVGSPNDNETSGAVIKFISEILMDEKIVEKSCMFLDPLAVQTAEKSFYEVLGQEYTPSPTQPLLYIDSSDNIGSDCSNSYSGNGASNSGGSGYVSEPSSLQVSVSSVGHRDSELSLDTPPSNLNIPSGGLNGLLNTSVSMVSNPYSLSESESALLFTQAMEEANKFLPPKANLVNLENHILPQHSRNRISKLVVQVEGGKALSPNGSRGRKIHPRQDIDVEDERSSKQPAVYEEEDKLLDLFDRVVICPPDGQKNIREQIIDQSRESEVERSASRREGKKVEIVDLRNLLILCAEAANVNDRRSAADLLKQIRQHSSPFGNGCQRVSHYFANAIEARLDGTGTQIYACLASQPTSAADLLKAFKLYLSSCPFKENYIHFVNHHILNLAEKAATIHIIDFGIRYGMQWPLLIRCLAARPCGHPKLRITGIELPQPGFRPAERVEETGTRLAGYCERFNVPFEYHAVAKKWETIQIDDLKIDRDQAVVVNCFLGLETLLDETVLKSSPRDAVLNLIRKIKPDIFTHLVVNGSYSAPYFIQRFKEALFHYSTIFDMFDANFTCDNEGRLILEKGCQGQDLVNIVACEGSERVVRPETYKQWQARIARAGFRQLPTDKELLKRLDIKAKSGYHREFTVDEDGKWMLQGWKGRILAAASCWVPTWDSL